MTATVEDYPARVWCDGAGLPVLHLGGAFHMGYARVSFSVAGGASVLVVVLAALAAAQSPSTVPSASPSASPSALASESPSAAPSGPVPSASAPIALGPITWKRVTKGKDFASNPAAYAVGQLPDGRLVVLGTVGDANGAPTGAGWVSADGSKWARLKINAPKGSAITAIATLDGTAVASGTAGAGAEVAEGLVWTSADGTVWSPATHVAGQVYSLASVPGGLIGAGILGDAATVWTTTDAVTWTPVTLAPAGRALHVVAGPDGTLVVSGAIGEPQGDSSPAVWTSTDGGLTWSQTILDGLLPGIWSIPATAMTPLGFLVTLSEIGQTGSIGHVWTSPDGVAWSERFVDPGSLLAAGSVGTDALVIGHGQVVRSSDGVTWTPTDEESFSDWQVRDVMTLTDGRLFAAGDGFVGQTGSALATWIGTAEPAP